MISVSAVNSALSTTSEFTTKHLGVMMGCDGAPFFVSKILGAILHPVTTLNLFLLGSLGVIQLIHTHAHHKMDMDVHSHVRQFCKKNIETCERYISEDDY